MWLLIWGKNCTCEVTRSINDSPAIFSPYPTNSALHYTYMKYRRVGCTGLEALGHLQGSHPGHFDQEIR